MTDGLLALAAGVAVGGLFGALGLPVPAPQSLPGVLGVVGLAIGFGVVEWFFGR